MEITGDGEYQKAAAEAASNEAAPWKYWNNISAYWLISEVPLMIRQNGGIARDILCWNFQPIRCSGK